MLKIKNMQLSQLKALNKEIEARDRKSANIALTNHWLQKQYTKNIQNEYDRIRNFLESSSSPHIINHEVIKNRKNELEKLGAKMYVGIG